MANKTAFSKPTADQLKDDAKSVAKDAQNNIYIDRLTRVGLATRGILYGLIGFLAFQLVFNGRGKITDQNGVLATIAAQPFGKVLLAVIAVGLIGLFFWGLIRAVADPYHKGNDAKGIIARVGFLISGIAYGALLIPTVNLLSGAGQKGGGGTQSAQKAAAGILTHSWGPFVVGAIGLALGIVGLIQIYRGLEAKFDDRLKSYEMTPEQHKWAIRLGRFGTASRGVVFAIIGLLAILAAVTLDPKRVSGIDGALTFLQRQPYGPYILGIVALGLIAFGIYSFMGALWFKIKNR